MRFKKIISLFLAAIMMLSMAACSAKEVDEYKDTEVGQAIELTGKYLRKKAGTLKFGDEEKVIALLRSDYVDYWDNKIEIYRSNLNKYLNNTGGVVGKGSEIYYDRYDDVIMAYTAAGIYANASAYADLVDGVSIDDYVLRGGYLNKIRALTSLECGDYRVWEKGDLTKEDLVSFILSLQKEDGSFTYSGRKDSTIKITGEAVIALSLTDKTEEVELAIAKGVGYLKGNVSSDMTLDDLAVSIIALNTRGEDARDVGGTDLVGALLAYGREDGSYARDKSAKRGNVDDSATALLALGSQRRFDKGLTSVYDMSDVLGGTHNQLSPAWTTYVRMMITFIGAAIAFIVVVLIISRFRISKWRKEGLYDEETGYKMTVEEAAEKKLREAKRKAAEKVREVKEDIEEAKENVREKAEEVKKDIEEAKEDIKEDIREAKEDIKEDLEEKKEEVRAARGNVFDISKTRSKAEELAFKGKSASEIIEKVSTRDFTDEEFGKEEKIIELADIKADLKETGEVIGAVLGNISEISKSRSKAEQMADEGRSAGEIIRQIGAKIVVEAKAEAEDAQAVEETVTAGEVPQTVEPEEPEETAEAIEPSQPAEGDTESDDTHTEE